MTLKEDRMYRYDYDHLMKVLNKQQKLTQEAAHRRHIMSDWKYWQGGSDLARPDVELERPAIYSVSFCGKCDCALFLNWDTLTLLPSDTPSRDSMFALHALELPCLSDLGGSILQAKPRS